VDRFAREAPSDEPMKEPSRRGASPTTDDLVGAIDRALRAAGTPERAVAEKAYLKSPIEHYGASVPAIRKAAKEAVRAHGTLSRRRLLALVRRLWSSPIHDQRMAAVTLLEEHATVLKPDDLALVERMIRGSFTWAYVDNLAANVAGVLVDAYPALAAELDRWAEDESFWVRRASMLALMPALRRGNGDWERFTRYADRMLGESEFFIRKAIGWVLRETSKKRPALVRRYVRSRIDRLAALTFREAIKRLPEQDRDALREEYRAAL
jgi:3-methyladenine DNA glycosylase AlkD